jgi:hypothetical protein
MDKPQWSLSELLSAVLFAALAAGSYRILWSDDHPNAHLWLAMFLATLTTATLAAWRGHVAIRRQVLGYAAFGWFHLAIVLTLFGWPLSDINDAARMKTGCQAGMLLGLLAAIAACWVLPPAAPPPP